MISLTNNVRDIGLVAAAYNGGLEAALLWATGRGALSEETSNYRETIMKMWSRRSAPTPG